MGNWVRKTASTLAAAAGTEECMCDGYARAVGDRESGVEKTLLTGRAISDSALLRGCWEG